MSDPKSKPGGPSAVSSSRAVHRIGAVAEATGLSQHAIRVWERRYGAVEPHRTDGGSRLYSELDVRRLMLLQRLTHSGHAISALAKLPTSKLDTLAGDAPEDEAIQSIPYGFGEEFWVALEALDPRRLENVLLRATARMEPRELAVDLVAPLAQEVGRRWQLGELTIAQEHAATAALRDLLTRLRSRYSAPAALPLLVAGTLSGEKHELGLLIATLLATMLGWNTLYLGTELPAEELVRTVRGSNAKLLLVSAVADGGLGTRAVLKELRAQLPDSVEIIVGGRAACDVAGVYRPRTLEDFESKISGLAG